MTMPSSTSALPATLWPPPAHGNEHVVRTGKADGVQNVGDTGAMDDQRRAVLATSSIRLMRSRVRCVMQRGDNRNGDRPRWAGRRWAVRSGLDPPSSLTLESLG